LRQQEILGIFWLFLAGDINMTRRYFKEDGFKGIEEYEPCRWRGHSMDLEVEREGANQRPAGCATSGAATLPEDTGGYPVPQRELPHFPISKMTRMLGSKICVPSLSRLSCPIAASPPGK
jgi:hypothetical protein